MFETTETRPDPSNQIVNLAEAVKFLAETNWTEAVSGEVAALVQAIGRIREENWPTPVKAEVQA